MLDLSVAVLAVVKSSMENVMTTYDCSVYEEDGYIVIVFDPVVYQHMNNPEYLAITGFDPSQDKFKFRWYLMDNERGFAFDHSSGKPTLRILKSSHFA
jgi:hypothetical protein